MTCTRGLAALIQGASRESTGLPERFLPGAYFMHTAVPRPYRRLSLRARSQPSRAEPTSCIHPPSSLTSRRHPRQPGFTRRSHHQESGSAHWCRPLHPAPPFTLHCKALRPPTSHPASLSTPALDSCCRAPPAPRLCRCCAALRALAAAPLVPPVAAPYAATLLAR
jgi:hypothetical protein